MKKYVVACLSSLFLLALPLPGQAQNRVLPDFVELVEKYGSAVVNVSTTQRVRSSALQPKQARPGSQGNPGGMQPFGLDEDDPLFDLFRRLLPGQPGFPGGQNVPREAETRSLGSGFIVSAEGYILTNAHVIDAADEILVRLTDKREFKAKVIGADKRTDVALIKIEAGGSLPVVRLGDPNTLKVGEWVLAIGSPFGFENSVTAGIVSAKGRSLPQENFVPFIQTDVAVNPGNSGGPLFNMKGEVVGINSQIYSRSGGFMGISFAIPIDVAMDVQNQLRARGKVSRGRIGVTIQEVSKELAESFGLSKAQGALVSAVQEGSPADKAGIEAGDVILKFDGKAVASAQDLTRLVAATRPKTQVPVQLWRQGALKEVSVTLGEIVDVKVAGKASANAQNGAAAAAENRLGVVFAELSSEQKRRLNATHGLLVVDARALSVTADLRPGDLVLALINKGVSTELKTPEQFNRLLAALDKNALITLLLRRGEVQSFVTIKLSAKPGAE
ncbi:MAG: DegQ family serine endoprotease [Pseudomonadota bacterium]